MYPQILWMTDFSVGAAAGRPLIAALARGASARVTVLHALGGADALEAPALEELGEQAARLDALGVETDTLLLEALPEAATAHLEPGGLIAVGRTGNTRLMDRLLLGSTTQRLLRRAEGPVLVYGGRIPARLERLLCPLAPNAPLRPQLDHAVALAQVHDAELTFLSVFLDIDVVDADEELRRLRAAVAGSGLTEGTRHRFEVGTAQSIEAGIRAASAEYDLVITGNQNRTGLARLLLGSVSGYLASDGPIPVLIIR